MIRFRRAIASGVASTLLGFVALSAQGTPATPAAGAQKRSPEEILAVHTKDDKGGNAEAGGLAALNLVRGDISSAASFIHATPP